MGRGDVTERESRDACVAAKDAQSTLTRGYSSAGRAPALQAGGRRFEPDYLHQKTKSQLTEQTNASRRLRGNEQERRQAPLGCGVFVTRRGDAAESTRNNVILTHRANQWNVCEVKRRRDGMSELWRERRNEGYEVHANVIQNSNYKPAERL